MAKNRKNSAGGGVRLGPVVKAFFICMVLCSLGVTYVWQKRQIYSLGVKTEQLEKKLTTLKRENEMRRQQMAMLQQMMQMMGMGGGPGGSSPGGNPVGGGTDKASPLANGRGDGSAGTERRIDQASGRDTASLPVEFREALEGYYNTADKNP